MYHDVVPAGCEDASGFPGRDAALYKVTPELFEAHLKALAELRRIEGKIGSAIPVLTFDDGGISALYAAEVLEQYGFRGHFFVTVNYIATPGFVDERAMRELSGRGHTIGSHSCSHPLRMAHCSRDQLANEWTASRSTLEDIVGQEVRVASVPGGDYARHVAIAAAEAGFTRLFTSEPRSRLERLGTMTIHGRFTIQRWTSARIAAALAAGKWLPRARQVIAWEAKKIGKHLGGESYLRLRRLLLRHGDKVVWGDRVGEPERGRRDRGSGIRD